MVVAIVSAPLVPVYVALVGAVPSPAARRLARNVAPMPVTRAVGGHAEAVVGAGAVGDHGRGLVERRRLEVRAGQVVDRGGVGPARGQGVERLDVVQVHDDAGDVAGEAHAAAVGRQGEVLAAALPLKSSMSVPPWPSTVSLASPGSQVKRSLPVPSSAMSLPWLPSTRSLPSPPIRLSTPFDAAHRVVVAAAVERELRQRSGVADGAERVRAVAARGDDALGHDVDAAPRTAAAAVAAKSNASAFEVPV